MIRQPRHYRLVLAGCLLTLASAGTGCSKPPAPEFRVINESNLKVKVAGGEEIVSAAPAPASATKSDGEKK